MLTLIQLIALVLVQGIMTGRRGKGPFSFVQKLTMPSWVWGGCSLLRVYFMIAIILSISVPFAGIFLASYPAILVPYLDKCILNGFATYYPECDIFPGAHVMIFLLNTLFYFVVGAACSAVRSLLRQNKK
jgi:hypothetical protein